MLRTSLISVLSRPFYVYFFTISVYLRVSCFLVSALDAPSRTGVLLLRIWLLFYCASRTRTLVVVCHVFNSAHGTLLLHPLVHVHWPSV